MASRVGQQYGNYKLVRLLGQGAFASVYLGMHTYLNTPAAIKFLHASLPPDFEKQFRHEAQTIAHLEHPNIVRLYDYGIENSVPFLVMQYAPKGTARLAYPKGKSVPLGLVIAGVMQIAMALQYAHNKRIIHQDVKPENMLISDEGQLLLSDFGIATPIQQTNLMRTGQLAGTPYYAAPEQHQGKPRIESDQYSLAVVAYEWLCGDVPFHGNSMADLALKHMQAMPPPLRNRVFILPAVEEVILRALSKDPKMRFKSVQEFAQALQDVFDTASGPPTGPHDDP